jgi:tellurite resistance protein TehA-like permease
MKNIFLFIKRSVLSCSKTLYPGYFALVMATGALSICSYFLQFKVLAALLLGAAFLAYSVLSILTVIRLFVYPKKIFIDLADHSRGPGFFTQVAASAILGAAFFVQNLYSAFSDFFWWLGLALWLLVMYSFFIIITVRPKKPTLTEGLNGAWLLAAVATQSMAVLSVLLAGNDAGELKAFIGLCFYFLGAILYLSIIPLILYRLTFLKVTVDSLTPPYWINMGAVAITTLAGATLVGHGGSAVIQPFLGFISGLTLLFWVAASWWIPLLLGLTVWRYGVHRYSFQYEPSLWSAVFPLAIYSTATWSLSKQLELVFLQPIAPLFFTLAMLTWLLTNIGFWRMVFRSFRR